MSTTRHRGPWVDWRPQKATLTLLDQVRTVLEEYQLYLPLTCRQIFYRLVGVYLYDKTERAYTRLLEALGNARRAGIIDFDDIRDDGITADRPLGFYGKTEFWTAVGNTAANYRRHRLEGQEASVEVWCEATGMVPQLARVAGEYGITVYSSSGFDSLTAKYRAAERAAETGSLVVLHVGDHDPSGVHLFSSAYEDVEAWADSLGGVVSFERVAVTPEQIDTYNLPTAPPKATDRRAFDGQTCQAEALDPATLADIVTAAIEDQIDQDIYRGLLALEADERSELLAELSEFGSGPLTHATTEVTP